MLKSLRKLKSEQLIGLLFVLALHGAVLYGLWRYRLIFSTDKAVTVMVNLVDPPLHAQPKLPKPEPPKQRRPQRYDPPEPRRLATETPAAIPDQPVVYAPPAPLPPQPVVEAPSSPPLPVVLTEELSVSCPERSPPAYPMLSRRMNEQGKVVLRVELGEDGRVASVTVKTSSGYQRLDDAALSTVKTWRCTPSLRNGVAVRAMALQPFNFTLEGR